MINQVEPSNYSLQLPPANPNMQPALVNDLSYEPARPGAGLPMIEQAGNPLATLLCELLKPLTTLLSTVLNFLSGLIGAQGTGNLANAPANSEAPQAVVQDNAFASANPLEALKEFSAGFFKKISEGINLSDLFDLGNKVGSGVLGWVKKLF